MAGLPAMLLPEDVAPVAAGAAADDGDVLTGGMLLIMRRRGNVLSDLIRETEFSTNMSLS